MTKHPDLVVLGGGSGGLAAAKRAAEHGADVVLVEPNELGGTCVNRGCVPKKLLWQVARHMTERSGLAKAARAAESRVDFAALADQISDHISTIHKSFEDQLSARNIDLRRAYGRLSRDGTVTIGDDQFNAGKVLLATGAKPDLPDMQGADLMCTSDDVFGWTDLPRRLAILGGGYIGAEFASIFTALGVDVTLIQSAERLLPGFDAAAVAKVTDMLKARGVTIIYDTKPEAVERQGDDLALSLPDGSGIKADRIICAIGRSPNVATLGLSPEFFERAQTGALSVGEEFQTSLPGIYAIGDIADRLPLTPVATRDGETFADRAYGQGGTPIDLSLVSTAAFTIPAIAQVGELSQETEGHSTEALKNPVLAPALNPDSYRRLEWTDKTLCGAVFVADHAPELIAPFAALLAGQTQTEALADATAVHPSFGEEFIGR